MDVSNEDLLLRLQYSNTLSKNAFAAKFTLLKAFAKAPAACTWRVLHCFRTPRRKTTAEKACSIAPGHRLWSAFPGGLTFCAQNASVLRRRSPICADRLEHSAKRYVQNPHEFCAQHSKFVILQLATASRRGDHLQ